MRIPAWHEPLESKLGELLSAGEWSEFTALFSRLLRHRRLCRSFFGDIHGKVVLLLTVHSYRGIGETTVIEILDAVRTVCGPEIETTADHFRKRLEQLVGTRLSQ
jgi:hypothetical protein